jgi:protoporphyrinogen oxidase
MTKDMQNEPVQKVIILGGGFNGLRLAFLLNRKGYKVEIVERDSWLGGMVQTFSHTWNGKKFLFDYGPHLFFNDYVDDYRELLGDDLLQIRDRFAMVTRGGMLSYPLRPVEMFTRINPLLSAGYLLDFALYRLKKRKSAITEPPNLKTVMTERFGRKLFEDFYAPYIEKCCGLPSESISPLWAEERENVSGKNPVDNILKKVQSWFSRTVRERLARGNHPSASEIIACYPRKGAGQLCDLMARTLPPEVIHLGASVKSVLTESGQVNGLIVEKDGKSQTMRADLYISTIPLEQLVLAMKPQPQQELIAAAKSLTYRTVRLVNLIVDQARITDCLEIFSMVRNHPFKRVYEPKAMSPVMSPPDKSSLCMEVCCSEGDEIQTMPAKALIDICVDALLEMKVLTSRELVKDSFIVDIPNAYPVYRIGFEQDQQSLLDYVSGFRNLLTSGRQGLFRYHAMTNEVMEMADSIDRFLDGDRNKLHADNRRSRWGQSFY